MRAQIAMHFTPVGSLWAPIQREDSLAAELADGHYSRQTVGADGYMPPGRCVAFFHQGEPRRRARGKTPYTGGAVWGCVLNLDPVGATRWRNTIFRNTSTTPSSSLIREATARTYKAWIETYGDLPPVPLRTEVDIAATARGRSDKNPPGHCYAEAGWTWIWSMLAGHGRPKKAIYEAPPP